MFNFEMYIFDQDWVYNAHIGPSESKWWIGLNDIEIEGQWEWSDGSQLFPEIL